MEGLFAGWPYPVAVGVLTLIAFARGGATHVLGRAAASGAQRTRAARWLSSPGFTRAGAALNRWGPPVVSGSFLTVGFQTLVNLASGVTRMPLRRYLPALLLGAALWGLLYASVGFVAVSAWSALFDRAPGTAIALVVVAVLALVGFVVHQWRHRDDHSPAPEDSAERETVPARRPPQT